MMPDGLTPLLKRTEAGLPQAGPVARQQSAGADKSQRLQDIATVSEA